MRYRDMTDRRAALWLATSPLLMESLIRNRAQQGSRVLMPVCACVAAFAIALLVMGAWR